MPPYLIYLDHLERQQQEGERILTAVAASDFIDLLVAKHGSMKTKPAGVSLPRYIEIRQGERRRCFAAYEDQNKNNLLERGEWKGESYNFTSADSDNNDQLSMQELQKSVRADSERHFRAADDNGDGFLSQQEYINMLGGPAGARAVATAMDQDSNGAIKDSELRNARLFVTVEQCWPF